MVAISVKLGGTLAQLEAETVGELHLAIRATFSLPSSARLRVLARGKALPVEEELTMASAGVAEGARLLVMKSEVAEVEAAASAVPERMRGFEEDDERTRTGGLSTGVDRKGIVNRTQQRSPYSFGSLQALTVPLGAKPASSAAHALLQRLSTDRGILSIMQARKWSVGTLKEMPPEGKVGVSASCTMGLNKNKGEEIYLRLRTDDLQGLRPYHKLIPVLLHELTHNVHSDHDNAFTALCSELTREYAHFENKERRAQSIGGVVMAEPTALPPSECEGGGGRTLGGALPENSSSSRARREAAAAAAISRSLGGAMGKQDSTGTGASIAAEVSEVDAQTRPEECEICE